MKKNVFTLLVLILVFSLSSKANIYPPTLVAPTNAAVNQTPDVFLNWDAVPGALKYKVELATDAAFTIPMDIMCYASAMNASQLSFGTKYWWRVKALGLNDSSAWTASRTFTVTDLVTITSPVDSTFGRYPKLTIKWTNFTGVTFFDWEVDSTLAFDSPLYRKGTKAYASGTVGSTFSSQLNFNQFYFLRMRARHALDTSSWSPAIMFKTLITVKLKRPNDNYDTLQMPNVSAKWEWVGATYYDAAFAFDSALTSPIIKSVDSSSILTSTTPPDTVVFAVAPTLLFDTIYYWSARARNAFDTSAWQASRSFRTVKTVSLFKPVTGDINVTPKPKFQWKDITGITRYVLQYDTNANFSNPHEKIVYYDTLSYTITQQLLPFTKYYWRMRAESSVDISVWSTVWNFTTGPAIGIESNSLISENMSVYPNPCHGKLNIEIESPNPGSVSLMLSNILGQEVISREIYINHGKTSCILNLDNLTGGIYLLRLQDEKNTVTRKIILDK